MSTKSVKELQVNELAGYLVNDKCSRRTYFTPFAWMDLAELGFSDRSDFFKWSCTQELSMDVEWVYLSNVRYFGEYGDPLVVGSLKELIAVWQMLVSTSSPESRFKVDYPPKP